MKKYQEDGTLPIGKMGHKGRPPYAYPSDITSIAEYCDSQLGRTFNRTDIISDMVHVKHDERLIEAGISPIIARKKKMHRRTEGKYVVQLLQIRVTCRLQRM